MFTSSLLLTLFIPSFSQDAKPSTSQNCFAYFNNYHSTFDVCDLQAFRGTALTHYTVDDNKNSAGDNDNYEYWFNIGGAVAIDESIFPQVCYNSVKNHSYCNSTSTAQCPTENMISITDNVWAYQIKNKLAGNVSTQTDCFYLTDSNGGPPKWRLINDQNPVEGVILTYLNGDFDSNCEKNREFSIQFECENTGARFLPAEQSNIDEYTPCVYTWHVQSLYGCPTECPQTNYELCSAKGLCSYDDTHNASRCYCYGKYEGPECLIWNEQSKIYDLDKEPPVVSTFVHTFWNYNYTLTETNNITVNVTYDLSKWELVDDDVYQVSDLFNNANRSFTYYMGILQEISIPTTCKKIYDENNNTIDKAYAFQMNDITKECYVLGTTVSWQLFDEIDDPARGVTIKYADGGVCEGVNREFSVSLVCPDDKQTFNANVAKKITTFVEETSLCKYNIEIESAFACPYQCLTDVNKNEFSVCSAHGMCVADPYAGYVRCLCDDKWSDSVCQRAPTPSPTNFPTKLPSKSPTNKPTNKPTNAPTNKPTNRPSLSPVPAQTEIVIEKEKVSDDHTAFIISIIGLCLGVGVAVCIGRYCYRKMKNTHEEFKEYTQFKDNTKQNKLVGSTGFAIKNSARISNVGDVSDEENEDIDDQLL